jgi:hypothetical protein
MMAVFGKVARNDRKAEAVWRPAAAQSELWLSLFDL